MLRLSKRGVTEPMAIILCPVCHGKCACVVCNGFEEIYHEGPGKEEWKPCPVCAAAGARDYDTGVCQTCRGAGTIHESGERV
jgi:hypothetical protein